jgi:hypothetical protein
MWLPSIVLTSLFVLCQTCHAIADWTVGAAASLLYTDDVARFPLHAGFIKQ